MKMIEGLTAQGINLLRQFIACKSTELRSMIL